MISKKILTIVSSLIIFFSFIVKVYSIEPDVFVQSTVNRAAKTLGANLTKEERIEKNHELNKYDWQKPHQSNQTGTENAYHPNKNNDPIKKK